MKKMLQKSDTGIRSTGIAKTAQPWDFFPGRTVLSQAVVSSDLTTPPAASRNTGVTGFRSRPGPSGRGDSRETLRSDTGIGNTAQMRTSQPWDFFPGCTVLSQATVSLDLTTPPVGSRESGATGFRSRPGPSGRGDSRETLRRDTGIGSTGIAKTAQPWDFFPGRTVLSQATAPLNPGTQPRSANPWRHGQVMAGLDSPSSSTPVSRSVPLCSSASGVYPGRAGTVNPSSSPRPPVSRNVPPRPSTFGVYPDASGCLTGRLNGVTPDSRATARAARSSTLVSCLLSPVSWRRGPVPILNADSRRSGFTMIEILFAIMILALGLVMVAAAFPVAIKWTRQDSNSTIGRIIATNALGIIATEYTPTSFASITSSTPMPLPALPSLIDRTYAFGTPSPYPDLPPAGWTPPASGVSFQTTNSLYFWTALICVAPSQATSTLATAQPQPTYDLYILVFKKGNVSDTYTAATSGTPSLLGTGGVNPATDTNGTASDYLVPVVYQGLLANMPIGALGIDLDTGAVFRTIINNTGSSPQIWRNDVPLNASATAAPMTDPVAYAPPANGQTASPLIYIYTTTFTP